MYNAMNKIHCRRSWGPNAGPAAIATFATIVNPELDSSCYKVLLLIRCSLSCQLQISILCNIIHVRWNVFLRNVWGAVRKNILPDRFSTKSVISTHI